jgi:hypothetical protein
MNVRVLNDGAVPRAEISTEALGASLGALKNLLECEAVVEGRVDYSRLPDSPAYRQLCDRSRLLAQVAPESFRSDAERIAFWLNVYNALSIHGVVALRIRRSAMEVPSFFKRVAYRVGQHIFSLDDVSNGVLRRGAPHPATGRPQFRAGDPRLAYCPSAVDPRIHGAMVCVAAACPPVSFYTADRLDQQLELAARNLVGQLVRADLRRREIHLPLQFYYYARDFGGVAQVPGFLSRYLDESQHQLVLQALDERWRIRWDPYDWSLNVPA